MKHKYLRSVLLVLSTASVLMSSAQSVADGVKAIYYQKFKTAHEILQKLVTANPADAEANYWLGQVALNQPQPDLALASDIYNKALISTNKNPLIMVGLGHVELLEGKPAEGRAHFDAALAATNNRKGGDPIILTAVGRANADGDSKTGDRFYGIEKLQVAAKLDQKSPEIYVLIGIEHLKGGIESGGDAKRAFEAALERDSNYAKARYRIAKIFIGQRTKNLFIPMLEETVKIDPAYGPAWLALYNYYAERDVNKAKEYIEKYIAVSDKDCGTDLFYADYLLRAGNRDAALAKGKELETSCGGNNFPKVYKLLAMIYDRSGDSVQARDNFSKYISSETPGKITAEDYSNYALILTKFPGYDTAVENYANRSFSIDTALDARLKLAYSIAEIYCKKNNLQGASKWYAMVANMKPDLTAADYYYWGDAVTKCMTNTTDTLQRANYFATADSIYQQYGLKYPEQVQPYSFRAIAAKLFDRDTTLGTAIPAIDAYTAFLAKDTAKNKAGIIRNYYYLIPYYAKTKSFIKAIEAANAILALEPANEYALRVKQLLAKK